MSSSKASSFSVETDRLWSRGVPIDIAIDLSFPRGRRSGARARARALSCAAIGLGLCIPPASIAWMHERMHVYGFTLRDRVSQTDVTVRLRDADAGCATRRHSNPYWRLEDGGCWLDLERAVSTLASCLVFCVFALLAIPRDEMRPWPLPKHCVFGRRPDLILESLVSNICFDVGYSYCSHCARDIAFRSSASTSHDLI